ncbi:MAG TPA: hypothetical protein VGC11_04095 [Acidimicrobiia bacterium]
MTTSNEIDLREQAQLVAYERNQMLNAELRLRFLAQEHETADEASDAWQERLPFWQTDKNAALDLFLIHYRNLQDFLSPPAARSTDVTVGPFFDKRSSHRLDYTPTRTRDAINHRLAHITTHRLGIQERDKDWPTHDMLTDMDEAWARFRRELESTHRERLAWFDVVSQGTVEARRASARPTYGFTVNSTESVPAIDPGVSTWITGAPYPPA